MDAAYKAAHKREAPVSVEVTPKVALEGVELLARSYGKAQDRIVELERELAEARGEASDPEWDRIQALSDDEVKAELIADGVYKDEADIVEHATKFTLRVNEMLRMKRAGEKLGRERLTEEMRAQAKEQGPGTLEVGTNERGEVVVNLDQDRTGHIVFSPREVLKFARTLLKMSERARQEQAASAKEG